ncbi:B12-binding domain-containing radical SAM protein [Candidatus Magnetomonas plexicatena]|uniref:B12-binding domain-containing radical SAM protein n=1 Tax=Candidatus Magnetomonas plexicatena TaxID=2552947 RepID=UPI0011034A36|nr:radical SAM protein [Nitrospirales bacterium LBB_01]
MIHFRCDEIFAALCEVKMKTVFVRLHTTADEIIPPLNYGYLSSSISDKNTLIFDQLRDRDSDTDLIKKIIYEKPDILGFSAYTKDISFVKRFVTQLRSSLPNTTIVLGGVQITLMPVETFKYLDGLIDYGFKGESELAFKQFTDKLPRPGDNLDSFDNLIWLKDGQVTENALIPPKNLDELPFPRWDLMPPGTYPKAPHGAFYKQFPYAPLITSRGCPYPCTFCSAGFISGKKIRYRCIENVIDEIKYLNKNFNVKEIHIEDDNFSMEKERVVDFCESLMRTNLNITWALPNGLRLDSLDLEVLKLMTRAGCYSVNVGVESGNESRLKLIKKKITKETIKEKIALVKQAGMDIGGFFIIGFPGETRKEIEQTLKFTTELELDRIGISYFQPYPGTEDFKQLLNDKQYSFDLENAHHSLHTISFIPDGMSYNAIKILRFKGFLKFYFRPKIFLQLIKTIKSFEHLKFILKRGLRWLTS